MNRGLPLRKVAAILDIDQAILSKIERGQRKIRRDQVIKLAEFFQYDQKEMLIAYLSDRIIHEVGNEAYAKESLLVAEEQLGYKTVPKAGRKIIISRISQILEQFPGVNKAWVFGSFSRMEEDTFNDIDLAVQTDKGFSYFDLAELQYQLKNILKHKVDIGFIDSIRPEMLKNVRKDLKLIYER
jgi:predicted nucleotidyltransferase